MKFISTFLGAFLLFNIACQDVFLGEEAQNDPVEIFELFWKDYDEHSGIIFPKNINWDSVYQVYRPQISSNTTEAELWQIFVEMIEVFDDEHSFIENSETGEFHVSGSERIGAAIEAFSKDLIHNRYLETLTILDTLRAPDMSYGKIRDKNIGYIYFGDTDAYQPAELMDEILEELGRYDALVFDVRNNGGGSGTVANLITQAFAESDKKIFSEQTRNGPAYDDFDEKVFFYNKNDGINQYLKPLIVLTDRFSVSGAEHVTLYLGSNSQVTHMGDTTAGAFSSTSNRRFLPNGWMYQYPVQMSLTPEGKPLDNDGLVPDILSIGTKADIDAGKDLVLERAILYLFDTYGIE
ncbi:MAG: S41 family peptidase [Bacteroidota bacterium]